MLKSLRSFFQSLSGEQRPQKTTYVLLRDMNDADGTRYLGAKLTGQGDLVIEGRDMGDGVERVLGEREYEWAWTIRAANLPALQTALGSQNDDLLATLEQRFSGNNAAGLAAFLEDNGIELEYWSRMGD